MRHSGPKDLPRETTGYENQPEAVFWELRAKEIEDMTGICNYMGTYSGARALGPADYAEIISAAMGIEISEKELMRLGQKTYNLEKAFNTIHAGFTREDDYPPRRYMEEPVNAGPYAGFKCDKEAWDQMLDRFYELHGWDTQTGWQSELIAACRRACLERDHEAAARRPARVASTPANCSFNWARLSRSFCTTSAGARSTNPWLASFFSLPWICPSNFCCSFSLRTISAPTSM